MYVIGHRNGNVYNVINGQVMGTLLHVDISAGAGNEQGLLSMALHPQFKTNKLFYIYYTAPNGNMTIDEFERMTPTTSMKKGNIYNQPRLGGGASTTAGRSTSARRTPSRSSTCPSGTTTTATSRPWPTVESVASWRSTSPPR
jgi:hypothetical protein